MAHLAEPIATRRAAAYRKRVRELVEAADREGRVDIRRYLLNQARTFQAAADAIAPLPEPQVFSRHR